jgi:hypothetical protein
MSLIPEVFREGAEQAWMQRDVAQILCYIDNLDCLAFVVDNLRSLKIAGLYEEALLDAYFITRVNHHRWELGALQMIFEVADRKVMLGLCEDIPTPLPCTIYRGVSGRGRNRRVRGLSWTLDFEQAKWFATRYKELPSPAVYQYTVKDDRYIYAYSNDRQEQEVVCLLPRHAKPKLVWGTDSKR